MRLLSVTRSARSLRRRFGFLRNAKSLIADGARLADDGRCGEALPLLMDGLSDIASLAPDSICRAVPLLVRCVSNDDDRWAAVARLGHVLGWGGSLAISLADTVLANPLMLAWVILMRYREIWWAYGLYVVGTNVVFAVQVRRKTKRWVAAVLDGLVALRGVEALDAVCGQLSRRGRADLAWEALGKLAACVEAGGEARLSAASQRAIAMRAGGTGDEPQLRLLGMIGGTEAVAAIQERLAGEVPDEVRPMLARAMDVIERRMERDRLSVALLQPASAPQPAGDQLLRPAAGPPEVDEKQLLRPGEGPVE